MKIYSSFGFNEFIICLGYKGYVIKEYFANYFLHQSDVTIDISNNIVKTHESFVEPWKITLVDTGKDTMTGGRIKRVAKHIGSEPFLLTYGDGVGDINIPDLVDFHQKSNCLLTVTAVQPTGRFGALNIADNNYVTKFSEKPNGDGSWINGGYFVCQPDILEYIDGDDSIFEKGPMEKLAINNQMAAYKHTGFWKPMDTLRDKIELENAWNAGNAQWKIW